MVEGASVLHENSQQMRKPIELVRYPFDSIRSEL